MRNLLLVFLISTVSFLNAQSVSFVDADGNALPDTVVVSYNIDDTYLDDHPNLSIYDNFIKNNTSVDKNVIMTREIIEYVTDSLEIDEWGDGTLVWKQPEDQFCWGQCVIVDNKTSYKELGPEVLAADAQVDLSTLIHYTHYKLPGSTILEYKAFVDGNAEATLVVVFEIIDNSVGFNNNDFAAIKAYPNPVSNTLNITGTENVVELTLTNLIGQVVYSTKSIYGDIQLNMSEYNDGMYILVLKDEDDNIHTERIIKK